MLNACDNFEPQMAVKGAQNTEFLLFQNIEKTLRCGTEGVNYF